MKLLADDLPDFPDFPPGEVWLAGAGPGDPGLLTLHALHALRAADDIVHDALVDPRILQLAGNQAKLIFAGKRGGRPSSQQADINDLLIERAQGVGAPAIVIVGAIAEMRQRLLANMVGWP
jgi:uroporphyrin-III C-methyltransferase